MEACLQRAGKGKSTSALPYVELGGFSLSMLRIFVGLEFLQ